MKATLPMAWRRNLTAATTASLIAAATTLTACDGSDGADTTLAQPEDAGAVRFLSTTSFRGGRLLLLLSFEGGLSYGFYQFDPSKPTLGYAYDGLFVVRRLPSAEEADPTVGVDYNFEQGTTRPATLALTAPNAFGITLGALTTVTSGPPANTTETEPFGERESANESLDTDTTTLRALTPHRGARSTPAFGSQPRSKTVT